MGPTFFEVRPGILAKNESQEILSQLQGAGGLLLGQGERTMHLASGARLPPLRHEEIND